MAAPDVHEMGVLPDGALELFLAGYPPFDQLEPAARRDLLIGVRRPTLAAGEVALVEDGAPAAGLWVVMRGSFELVHEGEVIQVLGPGECFGHPSLLTGMAPAFTVRARERSDCLLIAPAQARRALGTEAGAAYVAQTLRTRLTRSGHTVHGLLDVGTTPVSAIMRPIEAIAPDSTVRGVLAALDRPGTDALLLRGADRTMSIIADADVRAALSAGTLQLDAPAATLARGSAATVPVGQLAIEATVDMLAAGAHQLLVLDGESPCGVLSAGDLLGLEARSPIALRHTVLGAPDEQVLLRAVSHLPQLFVVLVRAGVPSRDLGRVLSLQHDAVVSRLIDFSIWRHGPAPVAWAWLDLGSAARREFTLASDQDNGFAYGTPSPGEEASVDAYFAQLGREVNEGLARCGFGVDHNGVLASDRRWRMSRRDWLKMFDDCLTIPDESHLIRATVAFDFRSAAGGLVIAAELAARIRAARQHPEFMRLMARSGSGFPVALGHRGQLAPERKGEAAGRIDLKRSAIIPLVNLVRFHALAAGVTISPTLDRIEAAVSAGGIDAATGEALAEAFNVITRLRFEHHAEQIAAGLSPTNLIDPELLAPIARIELREALHSVRRAQKHASMW